MGHPQVALTTADGEARNPALIAAELSALTAGTWVVLGSCGDGPWIERAAAAALASGLQVRLDLEATDVQVPRMGAWVAAGVRIVSGVVPEAAWLAHVPQVVGLKGVARLPLTADLPDVADVIAAAAPLDLEVVHAGAPSTATTRQWLDALWTSCVASSVSVRFFGVTVPPACAASPTPPPALHPSLIDVVRGDLALDSLASGVTLGSAPDVRATAERVGDLPSMGRLLGAIGMPVRELGLCEGGQGEGEGVRCQLCPGAPDCGGQPASLGGHPSAPAPWTGLGGGARIHVVAPPIGDHALLQSTLPGLVQRLRAHGAHAVLHSAWASPFNPHGVAEPEVPQLTDDHDVRADWAKAHAADFVRKLDLRDADCVIVPGWFWGDVVFRHKSLPADARVVVADFHLMHGIDRWKKRYLGDGERSLSATWWPDPRIHVHSSFPGYARLAWYAGVPMAQVLWRPYPLHLASFPAGRDPLACDEIFAGGNHLRDHATLAAAVERLDGTCRPVSVCSHRRPRHLPPGMRFVPPLPLPAFVERIGQSRFVVVSLEHVADKAAGISVVAFAQAMGRPVVATATPGTLDHVRHEVDGLWVPAGDPQALAAAMRRVDSDDALCASLARGARQAAERAGTDAWARALVHGVQPKRSAAPPGGPYRAW